MRRRNCESAVDSPLEQPISRGGIKIGNRIAVQPMEGWDGTADGKPSELYDPSLEEIRPERRKT